MVTTTLSLYESADWGARTAGVATAHKDTEGTLFINDVRVHRIRVVGQFSILEDAGGRAWVVLSSFLRLVPDPRRTGTAAG
jgi:hypothetical protein